MTTYLCCEIAVDRKIVPFERVPDHAGGNYSASLCGVHLTPQCLRSAKPVSRGVSLVNFFVVSGVQHTEACALPRLSSTCVARRL